MNLHVIVDDVRPRAWYPETRTALYYVEVGQQIFFAEKLSAKLPYGNITIVSGTDSVPDASNPTGDIILVHNAEIPRDVFRAAVDRLQSRMANNARLFIIMREPTDQSKLPGTRTLSIGRRDGNVYHLGYYSYKAVQDLVSGFGGLSGDVLLADSLGQFNRQVLADHVARQMDDYLILLVNKNTQPDEKLHAITVAKAAVASRRGLVAVATVGPDYVQAQHLRSMLAVVPKVKYLDNDLYDYEVPSDKDFDTIVLEFGKVLSGDGHVFTIGKDSNQDMFKWLDPDTVRDYVILAYKDGLVPEQQSHVVRALKMVRPRQGVVIVVR